MKTFKHSGDLGDIIYSLPTMRLLGGGVLCLDTSGGEDDEFCKLQCAPNGKTRFNKASFDFIKPLLEKQPYIKECREFVKGERIDFNLNKFRLKFLEVSDPSPENKNLVKLHLESFKQPVVDYNLPWLDVTPDSDRRREFIITRTPRYQSNYSFYVGLRQAGIFKESSFIGLKREHDLFEWAMESTIDFIQIKDALDMAGVIAASGTFISNPTFALSVAIGLGHRAIIQEFDSKCPTTFFKNRNGLHYV
jgi:hypothetical protein